MKRFDLASEVAKQLITLASAIITVLIAFYEKFFSHEDLTFLLVFLVLLIFIVSILLGVLSIGALTNLVESQEDNDWLVGHPPAAPPPAPVVAGGPVVAGAPVVAPVPAPGVAPPVPTFVRLTGSAPALARWQQGLFVFGLFLFIMIGIGDRVRGPGPDTKSPSPQVHLKLNHPIVWAQLRPDEGEAQGQLIARAIVEAGSNCPDLMFEGQGYWNGKSWPMAQRWIGSDGAFPIKTCEVTYPGHLAAKIGDIRLEPRPADPKTIVVIGDTGCRISDDEVQDCNNPEKWPFHLIAMAARAQKPDLIIHVGDYHYREARCPPNADCAGSPYGDNWDTWQRDFFDPAEPLLARAPWIMVRGNHEGWTRAGPGWQLLLSPRPRGAMEPPWPEELPPLRAAFRRPNHDGCRRSQLR